MLNWNNLTRKERSEYMRLQMSPKSLGRSSYLPDDCHICGSCEQPTLGSGWCLDCFRRWNDLHSKLIK